MRQIFPETGPELTVITGPAAGPLPDAVRQLANLYRNGPGRTEAGRRWLRANMISSVDGASALAGRSGGLGGPADRMVFTILRSIADVILVGAGTARAERYRPVPPDGIWAGLRPGCPTPPIAVISTSLDLDSCARLLTDAPPEAQTIVLTTAAAPARQLAALREHARVIVAGEKEVDAAAAVAALTGLGHQQILAEGGPHLLRQLAGSGLIDELCVTTSPVLAGGPAGRIVAAESAPAAALPAGLTLAHVLTHEGFLITRYVRLAD